MNFEDNGTPRPITYDPELRGYSTVLRFTLTWSRCINRGPLVEV